MDLTHGGNHSGGSANSASRARGSFSRGRGTSRGRRRGTARGGPQGRVHSGRRPGTETTTPTHRVKETTVALLQQL